MKGNKRSKIKGVRKMKEKREEVEGKKKNRGSSLAEKNAVENEIRAAFCRTRRIRERNRVLEQGSK